MVQRKLEELSQEECLALLRQAQVGRLVYLDEHGPAAEPVNYAMSGNAIVFRVEGGVKRHAMGQPALAFEVDFVDADHRSGWSVLVRGAGREVPIERVPELLRQMPDGFPAPWAAGIHNIWLQITPHMVTGRRLGEPESPTVF